MPWSAINSKCDFGPSYCSFLGLLTLVMDTFKLMDWVILKFSISGTLRF